MGVAKKQKGHGDTSSDTAVSLKKGDFTTPPVNPIFQKENGGSEIVISKPPFCAASPNSTVLLCLPAQLLQKRKETDAIKYKKIVSFFIFVHLKSTKALE